MGPQHENKAEIPKRLRRYLPAILAAIVSALLIPALAHAQNLSYDEIKLGVLAHDVHFLGGKEHGVDINPEVILQSPVSDAWAATVPGYLRWMVQPRPSLGAEFNSAGQTDQFYFGATWTWQVAGNLLTPDDGLIFSYSFGPGFNNGMVHATESDRKSLGGSVLFRESFEFGYRLAPRYQLSAYLDHISNGGLDRYNQSINDVGLRLGVRF
ncbi:MAG: acyloxyacyl hydrolase [Alphaproteobacteria bacterium]|nr:acyloxyacyl hydrolase [Alphaproteobacteria bacterium]